MIRTLRHLLLCTLLLPLLFACMGEGKILSKGKMEKVLYDMHLAEAFLNQTGGELKSEEKVRYFEAILTHNGVTQMQYDSSLVYYGKHVDEYREVYTRLLKRFDRENKQLDRLVIAEENAHKSPAGDSINLLGEPRLLALSPLQLSQTVANFTADDRYHKADRIVVELELIHREDSLTTFPTFGVTITYSDFSQSSTRLRFDNQNPMRFELTADLDKEIKEVKVTAHRGNLPPFPAPILLVRLNHVLRIHTSEEQQKQLSKATPNSIVDHDAPNQTPSDSTTTAKPAKVERSKRMEIMEQQSIRKRIDTKE